MSLINVEGNLDQQSRNVKLGASLRDSLNERGSLLARRIARKTSHFISPAPTFSNQQMRLIEITIYHAKDGTHLFRVAGNYLGSFWRREESDLWLIIEKWNWVCEIGEGNRRVKIDLVWCKARWLGIQVRTHWRFWVDNRLLVTGKHPPLAQYTKRNTKRFLTGFSRHLAAHSSVRFAVQEVLWSNEEDKRGVLIIVEKQ